MGAMNQTIATSVVTILACPLYYNYLSYTCLGVAEQGATGFIPGGVGNDPAPARRVCLGYDARSMQSPTIDGIILLQRTIQWAMGDPVTAGAVRRTFSGTYGAGLPTTVTLKARAESAGVISVTENLPAGWTPQGIVASAGTATAAANVITWDLWMDARTTATLSYLAVAPMSACGPTTFTGTTTVGGLIWPTGGDTILHQGQGSDGWENAPIAWTDSVTIGPGLPLGRADWFACDNSYVLHGDGADIWDLYDEFHYLYAYVLGDFAISANVDILPPLTDKWCKAGLMVRANETPGSPFVFISRTNGVPGQPGMGRGNGELAFQWRDVQDSAAGWDGSPNSPTFGSAPNNDAVRFTMTRTGNVVMVGYDDFEGNNIVSWRSHTAPNINPAKPNMVGLALTSHQEGALARARFWDVSLTGNLVTPPSGLTATAICNTQINLSWTDNSNNEEGFKIERKTGAAGSWVEIATVGAGVTTYQDVGLTSETTYWYRVRAYPPEDDCLFSNEASAYTANVPPIAAAAPFYQQIQVGIDPIVVVGDVSDLDGDTLTYQWLKGSEVLASGTVATVQGGGSVPVPGLNLPAGDPRFPVGQHVVELRVSDGVTSPVSAFAIVEVIDTMAPSISPVPSQTILWPPNDSLIPVSISANAFDNGGGIIHLDVEIVSSEPALVVAFSQTTSANGSGGLPDVYIDGVDDETGMIYLRLRAKRSGTDKNGRIYTVVVIATDAMGNQSGAMVQIFSPHDQGKK
jgi:hypothetical protein